MEDTEVSAKGYIPESTWNDSCASTATSANLNTCTAAIINQNSGTSLTAGVDLVAGGGGPSAFNAKPAWQMGTAGNPSDTFRDLPDLSFFAGDGFVSHSFYIVCQQDSNTGTGSSTSSCDLNSPFLDFQGVGGTSAGAPAFADIMALINQKTGQRQGNANFVLYQLYKKNTAGTICASAASPAGTCIFYDTPSGFNNSVACKGGSPNCSNTSTAANQYGVLVEPSSTTTPAWSTTANYDLATGLGSVNVTNLLAAWSTASFTGDTVTIACSAAGSACSTSSAISITHGQNATFIVDVTPTTASGSVALLASPPGKSPVGIGSFAQNGAITLNSGTVTITTNQLPGGTSYPVVADYGGDGTFAPGTSSPVNVTVTPEGSKTVVSVFTFDNNGNLLSKNATSVAYGSNYILQIAVEDSGGNQCAAQVVACPTGTVTLTDNSNPLKDFSGSNTVKLNSAGIAEDQTLPLVVGSHSLVASYIGDNSFNASTSAADAVSVTTAPTALAALASPTTVAVGAKVTLTANITTQSGGVAPTGSVTFSIVGGATLGTVTVTGTAASSLNSATPTSASATATLTTSQLPGGADSITATYTGDTNYAAASLAAPLTVTVNAGAMTTTTTLAANPTSITSGASVALTATVTATANNGPGVTGSVVFKNGSTSLGSGTCTSTAGTSTTAATCVATLSTTALTTVGSTTITATYQGDANYAAGSPASTTVTVTSKNQPTTTALSSSSTSISSGANVTLTATVTSTGGGAAPTGTVQFMNGTSALGAAATCTPSTSAATCTATMATALSHLMPPPAAPSGRPNVPLGLLYVVSTMLLLFFLAKLLLNHRNATVTTRLGYAFAAILLFVCVVVGITACGGGSSSSGGGGGGTSHTDSITAVYQGDGNYAPSTSSAVSITIQ
jgi:hypothetical protein